MQGENGKRRAALWKRYLLGTLLIIVATASATSVAAFREIDKVVDALKDNSLDIDDELAEADAGKPQTIMLIGSDKRPNDPRSGVPNDGPRSDTIILVRLDPSKEATALMSLPRDLKVEIPGHGTDKLNAAYSYGGPKLALKTVKRLTGLRINHVVNVDFGGFRETVNEIGCVYMDVDRRYYNPGGDYAQINVKQGYDRLCGDSALNYVRFRHTDNDLYRVARQQLFVRAFKDQIKASTGPLELPKLIKTITRNVEVGVGGNAELDGDTVLEYALFAYSLPPGNFFQSKLQGIEETPGFDLLVSQENIQKAIQEFSHPDVESPQKATQVALNEKPKPSPNKAPPPRETTVNVLNGNGVAGSAGTASSLLSERGYQPVFAPDGKSGNAPNWEYFKTRIHYDKAQAGAEAAAKKVATLFGTDDVQPLDAPTGALSNGAMLTVIVGQTFHGTLAEAPVDKTPQKQPANVAPGADASLAYLRERASKVPFKVMVPTVIERSSSIDRERPVRLYRIDPDGEHKTIRLTYRTGAREYWGVQMTDWEDASVLAERNFIRSIGGRTYELHYTGAKLHMVVLRQGGATYWVVNTLLDSLSNETMLAIAKGLKPLGSIK